MKKKLAKMNKNYIYFIMIGVVIIDQVIKFIVKSNINLHETITVISGFFDLCHIENVGAAWGILGGKLIILIPISILALILLVKYIRDSKDLDVLSILGLGIVAGGIIGNLIDRIVYGAVTDYLSFTFFDYSFPVFNFADMGIVIGMLILCFVIVRSEINDRRNRTRKR